MDWALQLLATFLWFGGNEIYRHISEESDGRGNTNNTSATSTRPTILHTTPSVPTTTSPPAITFALPTVTVPDQGTIEASTAKQIRSTSANPAFEEVIDYVADTTTESTKTGAEEMSTATSSTSTEQVDTAVDRVTLTNVPTDPAYRTVLSSTSFAITKDQDMTTSQYGRSMKIDEYLLRVTTTTQKLTSTTGKPATTGRLTTARNTFNKGKPPIQGISDGFERIIWGNPNWVVGKPQHYKTTRRSKTLGRG